MPRERERERIERKKDRESQFPRERERDKKREQVREEEGRCVWGGGGRECLLVHIPQPVVTEPKLCEYPAEVDHRGAELLDQHDGNGELVGLPRQCNRVQDDPKGLQTCIKPKSRDVNWL